MIQHIKRIAKKKSTIGLLSLMAASGTIYGVQHAKAPEPVRYVMAAVTKGTLLTTVTGSGQVSGQNQIDVKPNVSGAITKILVTTGQEVTAGTPLFEIDRKAAVKTVRDASQSVQDAELSVQSAQISLQKLKQPADAVTLIQAQNAVNQAKRDLDNLKAGTDPLDIKQAEADLAAQQENAKLADDGKTPKVVRNAYDNAVSVVKTTAQTLEQALYDADAILGNDRTGLNDSYEKLLSVLDSSKLAEANASYLAAKTSVNALKDQSDALQVTNEDIAKIKTALDTAQESMNLMEPFLQNVQDVLANTLTSSSFTQSSLDSLRNTIQSDRSSVASKLSTLTGQVQSIEAANTTYANAQLNVEKAQTSLEKLQKGTAPKDIASAEERVAEAEASLAKIQKGADPLDIQTSENSLAQRRSALVSAQNKLSDAEETLNDYTVKAPFDGIIAKIPVHEQDQASQSTALATLLTKAKVAELSLNEVDAAKIHTDQKVTLTFDAIPDLTIAGVVSEVDSIGTVTQGVVNYAIKISFVTQDDRIKTGMSVSASIVTDIRQDALLVPNSAVKRNGNGDATVQMLQNVDANAAQNPQGVTSNTAPQTQTFQAGLANDQQTEVVSGLKEGDLVISRTVDPATAAKAASAATTRTTGGSSSGAIRIPGVGGSGNVRFGG